MRELLFPISSAYKHCVMLSLTCELQRMYSMESTEWIREERNSLAKGPAKKTPAAAQRNQTGHFSLANSPKSTAGTAVSSTQFNCFRSFQNFDPAKPFFESDYPSQRFRPEEYQEDDPADPYYSPPPTFIPPESPNELKVEDRTALAVLPSETQVRVCYL